MENDLISRSALLDTLKDINETDYGSMSDYRAHMAVGNALRDVCRIVDAAPSIEAEPVRCRDCAYMRVPRCCPYQIAGFKVDDDWYCPMGVRREPDGE